MTRGRLVLIGAVAVTIFASAWLVVGRPPDGTGSPPTGSARGTAGSVTDPPLSSEDALAAVAWWDTQLFGFGFTGFEPEPRPAVPDAYRQLRVGTLDGRVTAVRTLPDGWSRSYVSGPVEGEVLVVADDGARSVVSTITAATGAEHILLRTDLIVPAAAIAPSGGDIWYVALRRDDGADLGLWRRPLGRAEAEQVIAGPLGEPFDDDDLSIWQLHFHPGGRWLAIQWCFGEVRCTTHLLDTQTGDVRSSDALGWPRGFTDTHLVARGLQGEGIVALNVATGDRTAWPGVAFSGGAVVKARGAWWLVGAEGTGAATKVLRLVPGAEPERLPGDDDVGETRFSIPLEAGVGPLPGSWTMRYPETIGTWPEEGPARHGMLIDLATGERVPLPPVVAQIAAPECPILPPSETPEGAAVGPSRSELRDGVRYVQWSSGEDVVTVAVGTPVVGRVEELLDGQLVDVRGQPGRVVVGRDHVSVVWEEDGCIYTLRRAPGTPVDALIEYAGRY